MKVISRCGDKNKAIYFRSVLVGDLFTSEGGVQFIRCDDCFIHGINNNYFLKNAVSTNGVFAVFENSEKIEAIHKNATIVEEGCD